MDDNLFASTASTHASNKTSFSYESILEAYKKIQPNITDETLRTIVVTSLIQEDGYFKYELDKGFAVLMSKGTWIRTKDYIEKSYGTTEHPSVYEYLSGIPIHEDDAMAFEIMHRGVFKFIEPSTDYSRYKVVIKEPYPYVTGML